MQVSYCLFFFMLNIRKEEEVLSREQLSKILSLIQRIPVEYSCAENLFLFEEVIDMMPFIWQESVIVFECRPLKPNSTYAPALSACAGVTDCK